MIDSTTPVYPETIPVPKIERTHQKRPRHSSVLMESGRIRRRRIHDTEIHYIQATWHFTEDSFSVFKTFFEVALINGEVAFSLVTYDEAPTPEEVYQITWELIFAEGSYQFTRSDNLFTVTALLEVVSQEQISIPDPHSPVVELELWYDEEGNENPDVCRHTIIFNTSGLSSGGFSSGGYVIQIASSASGPWYDHIFIREARATVKLNNDLLGEAWFKIVAAQSGATVRRAINPLASAIVPPGISITDLEGSPHELRADGPFPYAYSALENPMISNSDLYIVPRVRYQYSQTTLAWDGVPQIVSMSGAVGATHKWTRNRSDPTEETTMPVLGGYANNLAAYQTDFGHMVKGCSFLGGCRSPITCHLVDQHIYYTPRNELVGKFSAMAGVCDVPRIDQIRKDWTRDESGNFIAGLESQEFESGNSCNSYLPDLTSFLIEQTRGAASGGVGAPESGIIFQRTGTTVSGGEILDLGDGDAGQHRAGFLWNKVSVGVWSGASTWTTIRDNNWNASPVAFSNLDLQLTTGHEFYLSGGTSWTTSAGVGTTLANLAKAVTSDLAELAFQGDEFGEIEFEFFVLLTAHDDFSSFIDPGYVPPVVPPIPPVYVPSVFIGEDDFEDSLIETPPYQGGTGWFAGSSWTRKSTPALAGYDDFQAVDIEDANDGGILNTGDGWAAGSAWTRKIAFSTPGGHDFQTSELGPVHPALGPEGGTKWADVWVIKSAKAGGDDFQSYNDGVVFNDTTKELVPLSGGSRMGSFWVIKAVA